MKKNLITVLGLTIAILSFNGCSSAPTAPKESLERKVANEEPLAEHQDLRNKIDQYIATSPDLSEQQKKDLNDLFARSRLESDQIREESLKLESVLIQDVLAPEYNYAEVGLIKTKIKNLKNRELDLRANTLFSANKIVGHDNAHRNFLDDAFHFSY